MVTAQRFQPGDRAFVDGRPVTVIGYHTRVGRHATRLMVRGADGRDMDMYPAAVNHPDGDTPSEQAVLQVIDKNGSSYASNRTIPGLNHVHLGAVRALVRKGLVETFMGPDGTFARRATPTV